MKQTKNPNINTRDQQDINITWQIITCKICAGYDQYTLTDLEEKFSELYPIVKKINEQARTLVKRGL